MRKTCSARFVADLLRASCAPALIAVALLSVPSCAPRETPSSSKKKTRQPPTAFYNEGKILLIGVDVRAARVAGPSEFLPLQLLVANKSKRPLRLDRESVVLVRPDGVRLPVCTVRELRRDYGRSLPDENMGKAFIETIAGRFPDPPFHWQRLDFFPLRTEATVPRDSIDVLLADVVYGYVYFRQPDLAPGAIQGAYKLLLKLGGDDDTYVVDLVPFKLR